MASRPELHVLEAFAAETRRVMARRAPLGLGFALGLAAVSGLLELVYHYPARLALAATFAGEVTLTAGALLLMRRGRLRRHAIPITAVATFAITLSMIAYVTAVGASADALAFALILLLTGVALLCPWGARAQVPLAFGTVVAYVVALALGVRGGLPTAYGIAGVAGGAFTSILGAVFLELHRRTVFQQRVTLEEVRDRQVALLYEVTRTVTATLELRQVLRLVCENLLQALDLDRLWLFWRETPEGEVRAVLAEHGDGRATLSELPGDPRCFDDVLAAGPAGTPALREPTDEEQAVLGGVAPTRLLRLPLEFRAERVGMILADAGNDRVLPSASYLDLAATLGNSAAMAIANARLYALVHQHRTELQRLSSKGLAVVEEVMRRISRELHDDTCQALMAVTLDLALIARGLATQSPELHDGLQDVRARVVEVMQGVRRMSHLIHPPVLDDFGAIAAIESIAVKYREASGLHVQVHCTDVGVRFPPAVELLLFRLFQEALANALRHAAATRVSVLLAIEPGAVRIEIEDDGRGFDAPAYFRSPPPSAGLGLIGMRERVAHFGGAFHVISRPGRGTRIVATVPVDGEKRTAAAVA